MKRYNIVLEDNQEIVLASCSSLEQAKFYLKDMEERDRILQNYFGWSELPKYLIKEEN